MLKYRQENQSLVQPAQAQVPPRVPSYAKTTTRFQLKDHPIYPGLGDPSPTGEVQDEFAKYISGPLTSEKTSIFVYWQVSPVTISIRSILSQLISIGPQIRIPHALRYCHGLSSDSSVFCTLRTRLLVSWGD